MPARLPPPSLFVGLKVDRALERLLYGRDGVEEAILGSELLSRIQLKGDSYIGRAIPDGLNPAEFDNLAQNIRSILIRAGANVKRNCDQIRIFVLPEKEPAQAANQASAMT
ncbi:hypothetical protein L6R50_16075 [Myxococcota bacterium]|nr:hypothetical protein [Myxococcota bacterium]